MAITYKHVDNASGGGGDGSSWDLAGGSAAYTEAEFETYLEGSVAAETVIYIKGGTTLTLDSTIDSSARSGTAATPISLIGVKSSTTNTGASVTYSDWATGNDRPLFDCATYQLIVGQYYIIRNMRFSGETNYVVQCNDYCKIINCYFDQDYSSSAARYSLYIRAFSLILDCEFTSTNCGGAYLDYGANTIMYSYFHDMSNSTGGTGVYLYSATQNVEFCNFDNVYTPITNAGSYVDFRFVNNTFYGCVNTVNLGGGTNHLCINNLMDGSTSYGFSCSSQNDSNFFWNNWGDDTRNTDMWVNIATATAYKDYPNASLNGDPKFTTPGSDHSLQSDSPCLNAGMSIVLGVG